MNALPKKPILHALCALTILLPVGVPPVALANGDGTPLIDKVRSATAQFKDINVAISEGWVPATPCALARAS